MAVAGGSVVAYRCYVLADGLIHSQAVGNMAWSACTGIAEAMVRFEDDGGPVFVAGPDMAQLRIMWVQRRVTP